MFEHLGTLAAKAFKELAHELLHALRAVVLTGVIVGLTAGVATELIATLLTGRMPEGLTHLAAAALAVAFGYGAAVTVMLEEFIRIEVKAVEVVTKEAEKLGVEALKGAQAVAQHLETGAASLGQGALAEGGLLAAGAAHLAGNLGGGVLGTIQHAQQGVRAVEHNVAGHLHLPHGGGAAADETTQA